MKHWLIISLFFLSCTVVTNEMYAQSKSGYRLSNTKSKGRKGGFGRSSSSRGGGGFGGGGGALDKVSFGVVPGLSGGSNYIYLSATPTLAYNILDNWAAGVGATYAYSRLLGANVDSYGTSIFSRFIINQKAIIAVSYEWLYYKPVIQRGNIIEIHEPRWYDTLFIGGGFYYPVGDNGSFQLVGLYNMKFDTSENADNGPYNSPIIFVPGFYFNF